MNANNSVRQSPGFFDQLPEIWRRMGAFIVLATGVVALGVHFEAIQARVLEQDSRVELLASPAGQFYLAHSEIGRAFLVVGLLLIILFFVLPILRTMLPGPVMTSLSYLYALPGMIVVSPLLFMATFILVYAAAAALVVGIAGIIGFAMGYADD